MQVFDTVIRNAKVHTMDPDCSACEAIGIKGNRIECVGSDAEVSSGCCPSTSMINAHGRVVLPGFIDAHTHFVQMGVAKNNYVELDDVGSKNELLQQLKEFALQKETTGWVIGTGWDESKWSGDRTYLTKEEIDQAVPDRPVALSRVDWHLCCVNTAAMSVLDLSKSIRGLETKNDTPTGRLFEDAANGVQQAIKPTFEESVEGIEKATKIAHQHGVTSVHQMVVEESEFNKNMQVYQQLSRNGDLGVRVRQYFTPNYLDKAIALGLESGFGDNMLQIGGLKLFGDGSIGARTAWIDGEYADDPGNCGMSIWNTNDLKDLIARSHQHNIQVAIHGIGRCAIEQIISVFEDVVSEQESSFVNHRLEHGEMLNNDQIERMKRIGLIASMQPNFIGQWGLPGQMYVGRFGQELIETLNPLRTISDAGITLACGSDCMPFGPMYGIHWAVNSPFGKQALTVDQAIRAYTVGSAIAGNKVNELGSISAGKLADIVILDRDPYANTANIKDINIVTTICDGDVVFMKREENA